MSTARFFFKHRGCPVKKRGGWAIDVERCKKRLATAAAARDEAYKHPCPFCGAVPVPYAPYSDSGRLEYVPELMGRVEDRTGRLTESTLESVCDARCTNAIGPNCDCKCGGANHGSRALVERIKDRGAAPRALPLFGG